MIELRRVLGNMRDVASHLQRLETELIQRDLWPFLRDVYDHLARNLDMVEMQRDLLTGAMDIYLSSVANRTNQVMKVLTVLGTIALPAVVISGFYGMNTKGLPGIDSPYGADIALGLWSWQRRGCSSCSRSSIGSSPPSDHAPGRAWNWKRKAAHAFL